MRRGVSWVWGSGVAGCAWAAGNELTERKAASPGNADGFVPDGHAHSWSPGLTSPREWCPSADQMCPRSGRKPRNTGPYAAGGPLTCSGVRTVPSGAVLLRQRMRQNTPPPPPRWRTAPGRGGLGGAEARGAGVPVSGQPPPPSQRSCLLCRGSEAACARVGAWGAAEGGQQRPDRRAFQLASGSWERLRDSPRLCGPQDSSVGGCPAVWACPRGALVLSGACPCLPWGEGVPVLGRRALPFVQ